MQASTIRANLDLEFLNEDRKSHVLFEWLSPIIWLDENMILENNLYHNYVITSCANHVKEDNIGLEWKMSWYIGEPFDIERLSIDEVTPLWGRVKDFVTFVHECQ